MAARNERPHSPPAAGQRGSGTALKLTNEEAAAHLRNPAFIAAAARLYEVERLWSGKPRNAKSAVFYAALEGLALNIEHGGERTFSFTYGDWALIGNTWPRWPGGKSTTDEGVGTAFRVWKDDRQAIKAAPNVFVKLEFRSSKHGGGNTPGQASVSVAFLDAQGRTVDCERPDPSRNRASFALLGYDDVLTNQANALLAYARTRKLARRFTWPLPKRSTEYRVLLFPEKLEKEQAREARVGKIKGAALLFLFLAPLSMSGGWYLNERQTLKALESPGSLQFMRLDVVCRSGAPAVRLQIVLGTFLDRVSLVRRQVGSNGPHEPVRSFERGRDYEVTARMDGNPEAPSLRFTRAIDFVDYGVRPGLRYEYSLQVHSSLGETFTLIRDGRSDVVLPCPVAP